VTTAPSETTTPVRIHADRAAGTLAIEWGDGHQTTYGALTLRWLCPCAFCRGEAGQPGWLDSRPELTAEQTRLVDVQLVGQYAVAPLWGDGHHTGYYTYALLRDRCPCDDDAARRVREGKAGSPTPPDHDSHDSHAAQTDHTDHTGHTHSEGRHP
jgi:DUF971 family protein